MKKTTSSATTGALFEGYLSAKELCEQLGQIRGRRTISRRTLERWHALRIGPPRVRVGRLVLYKTEAVRRWLDENATSNFRKSGRPRA